MCRVRLLSSLGILVYFLKSSCSKRTIWLVVGFPLYTNYKFSDMDKKLKRKVNGIERKCDAILRELRRFGFRPGIRLLDSVRASARALHEMSMKERERMERERGRGLRH